MASRRRDGQYRSTLAAMSQKEIAALLGITVQSVEKTEQRALRKLMAHPTIRILAREYGFLGIVKVDR